MRLIGFIGTIVLARILTPRDFGIVAISLAITTIGMALADAGLAAGLLRARDAPARRTLESVVGFQFAATGVIVLLATPVLLQFGTVTQVTALMLVTLPVAAFRLPAAILLERELIYGRLVAIELSETVLYYICAIAAAAAGAGVWGLAGATVVRAFFGSALAVWWSPMRIVRPRLAWKEVRPMLNFGLAFQAAALVRIARQQGRDIGIGAIGGLVTLGVWSLAFRMLQIPFLLFEPLWRVTYPAMARLLDAGEDLRPTLDRVMRMAATAGGALVAVTAASAPAIVPVFFGSEWTGAIDIIWIACIGILISGPISIVAVGYLYAVGEAETVLRAELSVAAANLAGTFALLPVLGPPAIGVGWLMQAIIGSGMFARAMRRRVGVRPFASVRLPLLLTVASTAPGYLVAASGEPNLVKVGAGVIIPLLLLGASMWALDRSVLLSLRSLARSLLRRGAPARPLGE